MCALCDDSETDAWALRDMRTWEVPQLACFTCGTCDGQKDISKLQLVNDSTHSSITMQ